MKAWVLTFFMATFPFIGLHAADDNVVIEEPASATAQSVEAITRDNENPLEESSTETLVEASAETEDDNFVPSIRITEALPVAFPVDI